MSNWSLGKFSVKVTVAPAARPDALTVADPASAARWRAEGDRLRLRGDVAGADAAYARQMRATVSAPDLAQAADALIGGRLRDADAVLRQTLARRPDDALALWMAGDLASRGGRNGEAETLLERAVALAPAFTPARYAYAMVLTWRDRYGEALAEADGLLAAEPDNALFRHLRAAALLRLGEDAAAADAYAQVLAVHPELPLSWMSHGHALKTIGRTPEAIAAYRRALALDPALGEAWWSLANLKTAVFDSGDRDAMAAALARSDLQPLDRLQLHFALGKALEDACDYGPAFEHYARGNALQRSRLAYDPDETTRQTRRTRALLGRGFFAARAGQGCPRPDPIFIVGLPRSGSTLVEQILASHSQVEGTRELHYLPAIAGRLAGPARRESESAYPDVLAALSPAELADLGESYLASAQAHRRTDRPYSSTSCRTTGPTWG